jgi:1-acyl-sn-glycerol-3-phosphate acyltransferase
VVDVAKRPQGVAGSRGSTDRHHATDPEELPVRYTPAGGRIGATSRAEWLWTWWDVAVWLGLAPLPAHALGRVGARRSVSRVQRWWARRVARTLGLRIDWDGLELIDPRERYVVVALHEGFADALALLQLPLPLRFVARDELAEWPWLGGYLRNTGQLVIRPEAGLSAYRDLVRSAGRVFAAGDSLVVFPQGTILGIETDFHAGAFGLARALERPILPVALTGGHRVWEYPYSPRLRRGQRMSVRVLPPVSVEQVRARDSRALRREICRRLKAAALDGSMQPPRRFVPARDGYWDGYAYEIDPAFPDLAADVAAHRARQSADSPDRAA